MIGMKNITFITGFFMSCAVSQPTQPSQICYVCGRGFRVENLDAFVTLPNKLNSSCDEIEMDGLKGSYHPDKCSSITKKALSCGCKEGFRSLYKPQVVPLSAMKTAVTHLDSILVMLAGKHIPKVEASRMLRGSKHPKSRGKTNNFSRNGKSRLSE
jgi:hypothetical protein